MTVPDLGVGAQQDPGHDWVTVNTEYGPVTVPRKVLRLWDEYGWPPDATLRWMAEHPLANPDPQEQP